jgi:hypothetical protein
MAGLRRPTSLTGVLSDVKLNIETLQARGTTTGSSVSSITPSGNDDAGSAPGISSPTPLYLYKRVIKAFIYGSKVTGNTPRMELYFGEDPKIAQGAFVQIQGINGTSTDTWEEMSPAKYAVYAVDTPPWNDGARANQDWRDTPDTGNNGQTVTHTIWFNPDIEVPITYSTTSGRELITTRRIDSVSATGSTVTVNFNSTHVFREGDVISVDLEGALYGRDGLFKVSTVVDSNTIEYELETPLTSPISLSGSGLGTKYVYPVAHEYVEDGTIWNDTSVSPAKVYVWKEYRWYDTADPIGDVAATQDGVAPSPVTDLSGTSTLPEGETSPVIDLTWTAPTTRSDGSPISGVLAGYEVYYKRAAETKYKYEFVRDPGSSTVTHQIKDQLIQQNFTYTISVYAVDIMVQRSTEATVEVLTAKYSEVLNPPEAPTVTSKLGTITVDWSGLDSAGNLPAAGVLAVEIHESTSPGFTPSDATLVQVIPVSSGGNYAVLTGRLFDNITTYYYKIVFVRQISSTELVKSDPSAESPGIKVQGVVGPDIVAGSITTNNLEAGFVTAEIVRGGSIIAQEPLSTRRVEIKASGITAYSTGSPTNYSFELQSQTGNVLIVGGTLTSSTITGGTIQTTSQANTGIKMNNGGLFAYNGSSPTPTFSVDATTGAVVINGGSLTITSGLSGYIPTGGAAADINNPANTTTINGGKITTGSIDADRIGVNTLTAYLISGREIRLSAFPENDNSNPKISITKDRIAAFRLNGSTSFRLTKDGDFYGDDIFINDGTLSGTLEVTGNINGGSFSGGTFRTSLTGKRVLISSTSNSVVFFDPTGAEAGRIQGGLSGTGTFDFTGSGTASMSIGSVSTVFDGNLSTSGTSSILAAGRLGQNQFSSLGTVAAVGRFATTGFFGPTPSDLRLKENIEALADSLDIIKRLRPVKFTYKSEPDGPVNYGLIAQEVRELFDDRDHVVNEMDPADDGETYFSVEYISFVAPLIRAVQQLSDKIDDLESRLSS